VLWLPVGPPAAAAGCGTSCDTGPTALIPLEASVRLDKDHVSTTYLGAMVFDGVSAVVTPVGLATEVRDEGPLRRTVLNRRIYRPNPSFSRSLSLIAAGEPCLLSIFRQSSSIDP
jgi:hypothetical protein